VVSYVRHATALTRRLVIFRYRLVNLVRTGADEELRNRGAGLFPLEEKAGQPVV
jgi:hypothetical protein